MEIKTGVYKHFKGGQVYVILTAKHSNGEETDVVYLGLNNGEYYARPVESFLDEVEKDGKKVPRFSPASAEESAEIIANLPAEIKRKAIKIDDSFCL